MESLVEGVFGRAFSKQIHPVEIAKGLTKQMDEGRMVSVSRTYAPNDFTVHLSNDDVESIQAYQDSLREELIQYASTHAQNKNYHLMTPPKIRFARRGLAPLRRVRRHREADRRLRRHPREEAPLRTPPARPASSAPTPVRRSKNAEGTAAISPEEAKSQGLAREIVELTIDGKSHSLEGAGPWTVGRSEENDITISDPNISRKHARLLRAQNGFIVEDLGSTNGTLLDGAPIDRERIENGDELTFGQSVARFIRRNDASGEGRERRCSGQLRPVRTGAPGADKCWSFRCRSWRRRRCCCFCSSLSSTP